MPSPSLLLILPYFGRFNNYFPHFLMSCRNNPTVNWLIITDDKTDYDYPENVKVVYTTFPELRERVQASFDFPVTLESPYKLCDYKPAYGYIFNDEIKGYDFWGYCDNDLIFGDIRSFLTDDVLNGKEKVLSRGHLSLYRNNSFMNTFFKEHTEGFYRTALSSNRGYSFDEWGPYGIANHLKRELPEDKFWDGFPFDDISVLDSNFVPAQKRNEDKHNIVYSYDDGMLTKYFISGGGNFLRASALCALSETSAIR